MRIVTGKARGIGLVTPEGMHTRPTPSKVKEGIFSAIQFEIEGCRVLDLFAGSGQMGLEALSRGAKSALLCDSDSAAVAAIKQNAQKTKLFPDCQILQCDAYALISRLAGREQFDLIFLDPPYEQGAIDRLLCALASAEVIAPNAVLLCESEGEIVLPQGLHLRKTLSYGRVKIHILDAKGETK